MNTTNGAATGKTYSKQNTTWGAEGDFATALEYPTVTTAPEEATCRELALRW